MIRYNQGCQKCGSISPLLKRKGYYQFVCKECKRKLSHKDGGSGE